MTFRVLDSVDSALDRVVTLLETARDGTGRRLYREFLAACETMQGNSRFYALVEDPPDNTSQYREAPLLHSSYRVICQIRDTEIIVVALRHSHQKPVLGRVPSQMNNPSWSLSP